MSQLALIWAVALITVAAITPLIIGLMWRLKILDAPDGVRKLHGRTVPLAGGLAILAGGLVASGLAFLISPQVLLGRGGNTLFAIGLGCASLWVSLLGIADDRGLLRGRQKFLGQIVGALILTSCGCVISHLEFMDHTFELGMFSIPFTVFWLVGAINAVNLMDGVDGLATSIGAILSGTFAIMATIMGHPLEAMLAVTLCGALFGFLPYNFPRARIFLGDTGSMLIGLILGTLAMRSSVKSQASLAFAAPVAVLSVLIFDVVMAILRRKLTGRSLYSTDRGHLHHRLTQLGFPPTGVVLFVSLACVLCSAGAIASLVHRNDWLAIAVAGTILLSCVVAKIFGHNEFRLLLNRTKSLLKSIFQLSSKAGSSKGVQSAMQIQGHLNWGPVWQELRELALSLDLIRVELHISAPRFHEHYHADWARRTVEADGPWQTTVPLLNHGTIVGRISLWGELSTSSSLSSAEQLADILHSLKPTEFQIEELLSSAAQPELAPLEKSVA